MSLKEFAGSAGYVLAVGALAGLALTAHFSQYSAFDAEDGADYLREKGYTQVTGGQADYFNACGKGQIARNYDAVKSGEAVNRTVCYSYVWGPHLPLFGVGL